MSIDAIYTTPQPLTPQVIQSFRGSSSNSSAATGFESILNRVSAEMESASSNEVTWYVDPAGYAKDPGSMCNWSRTPKAGFLPATPTGRGVAAKYDPNADFIPEFKLSNGQVIMGLDRGPNDGSNSMRKLYG